MIFWKIDTWGIELFSLINIQSYRCIINNIKSDDCDRIACIFHVAEQYASGIWEIEFSLSIYLPSYIFVWNSNYILHYLKTCSANRLQCKLQDAIDWTMIKILKIIYNFPLFCKKNNKNHIRIYIYEDLRKNNNIRFTLSRVSYK